MLVSQLIEHLGFVLNPGVLLGVARHLEHVLLPVALDEQRDRAGTLPEPLDDGEAAGKQVALLRLRRIDDVLMLGCGQFVLDAIEAVRGSRRPSRSGWSRRDGCRT